MLFLDFRRTNLPHTLDFALPFVSTFTFPWISIVSVADSLGPAPIFLWDNEVRRVDEAATVDNAGDGALSFATTSGVQDPACSCGVPAKKGLLVAVSTTGPRVTKQDGELTEVGSDGREVATERLRGEPSLASASWEETLAV